LPAFSQPLSFSYFSYSEWFSSQSGGGNIAALFADVFPSQIFLPFIQKLAVIVENALDEVTPPSKKAMQ